jgi:hypothetical protein
MLDVQTSYADSVSAEPLPHASITRMAQLPVAGLQAVETTDGELLAFSDNRRYVLLGGLMAGLPEHAAGWGEAVAQRQFMQPRVRGYILE